MTKKLFVANFPDYVDANDLEKLFKRFGNCSASIAVNLRTRENLGWAFVEMAQDDDAERAIAGLNGREWLGGQRLKVSEARPKADRNRDYWGRR